MATMDDDEGDEGEGEGDENGDEAEEGDGAGESEKEKGDESGGGKGKESPPSSEKKSGAPENEEAVCDKGSLLSLLLDSGSSQDEDGMLDLFTALGLDEEQRPCSYPSFGCAVYTTDAKVERKASRPYRWFLGPMERETWLMVPRTRFVEDREPALTKP